LSWGFSRIEGIELPAIPGGPTCKPPSDERVHAQPEYLEGTKAGAWISTDNEQLLGKLRPCSPFNCIGAFCY